MGDATHPSKGSPQSVLLVEDDLVTVEIISAYLKKAGYGVGVASSAELALNAVADGTIPDLFLLDVGLPGMNGIELCAKLRGGEKTKNIPVIILTGDTTPECEALGLKAGAVDYIRKPVLSSILEARVGLQLRREEVLSRAGDNKDSGVPETILSQIRQFATSSGNGENGDNKSKLHILNLDPIQAAFSSRWDAISKKVIFIADSLISSSLIKGDAYKYFGSNLFAVVFPTLTHDEGRIRAKAIAEKVCKKLLGDEYDSGRYGKDFVEKILKFDLLEEGAEEAEKKGPNLQFEAMVRRIISEVSIEYRPIWNPATRSVDGYRASFLREYHGEKLLGKNILHGGASDPLWPHVYELMFNDIVSHIDIGDRRAPYYVITVHINFLLSKRFSTMVQRFLSKPELRKKLKIEINGVRDDIQISLFKAAVMLLRNLCDEVLIRTSPDSLVVHELKFFGINQIGFNLYDLIRSGLGERGSYVVGAHFSKKAAVLGFRGYVWGCNTVQDFQIMTAAKFECLSGGAFVTPDRKIHTVYPLPPALITNPLAK
jgi:DNA-binding response OmpR family regulator